MRWASRLSSRSSLGTLRLAPALQPAPFPHTIGSISSEDAPYRSRSPLRSPAQKGVSSAPHLPGSGARAGEVQGGASLGSAPQVRGRGGRPGEQCRWGKGARASGPLSQGKRGGTFSHLRAARGPDLPPPGTRQKLSPGSPCCPHPAPRSSRHPSPRSTHPAPRLT